MTFTSGVISGRGVKFWWDSQHHGHVARSRNRKRTSLSLTDILRNSLLESNDVTMSYYDVAFGKFCVQMDAERRKGGMESKGQTDRQSQNRQTDRQTESKIICAQENQIEECLINKINDKIMLMTFWFKFNLDISKPNNHLIAAYFFLLLTFILFIHCNFIIADGHNNRSHDSQFG